LSATTSSTDNLSNQNTILTPNSRGLDIYKRLARYSIKHWPYLVFAIIGLILAGITIPMFTIYLQPLLDGTFTEKDPEVIKLAPFIILTIFLLRGVGSFISSYCMEWVGRSVVKEVRGEIFLKLLHLPVSYFDKNNSGKLVTRLIFHVEQVSKAATQGLTVLVQDTVIVIGSLSIMMYFSFKLTLIVLLVAPLIGILVMYVAKNFRKISSLIQDQVSEVTQTGQEAIIANREIRIYDGIEYETQRFEDINESNHRSYMKRIIIERVSMPIVQFIMAIALSIIVYFATHGELLETFSAGSFTSFMMAMIGIFDPIKRLTRINSLLQGGISAGESIFSLLDEAPEKNTGNKTIKRALGNFEFSQVNFRYNDKSNSVLKNINLTVKQGEKIALVGQSGSGKTTLVNLLPRFYNDFDGHIKLDGIAINDYELQNLREQFAYVGQDITMFNDSVRNNIAYGNMRTDTNKQVKEAAEAAFALEFIEKLPQGFDTQVGENGTLLSGGQKQRIAIARAILSDAPILILDEATSALDTKSERHIQHALERLLENRTTFMIAHRLSSIEKADKILMMEAGEIIESGSHQELIKQKGAYYRLYQLQFEQS